MSRNGDPARGEPNVSLPPSSLHLPSQPSSNLLYNPKGNHNHPSSNRPRASAPSSSSRPARTFGKAFDEEDHDDLGSHHPSDHSHGQPSRREELTGYSRSGAEKARRSPSPLQGPRVIPLVGGSDWRGDRKRRLGLEDLQKFGSLTSMRAGAGVGDHSGIYPPPRDSELHRTGGIREGEETGKNEDGKQRMGLQLRHKIHKEAEEEEAKGKAGQRSERIVGAQGASSPTLQGDTTPPLRQAAAPCPLRSTTDEDEQARRALLATGTDPLASSRNADRTIALQSYNTFRLPLSEEESFKYDADSRPDPPTLEEYAATPVEEFGKALLRGMGWHEGKGAGKGGRGPSAPVEIKKRSALLGLGAKERPMATTAGNGGSGSIIRTTAVRGGTNGRDVKVKRLDAREYKPLVTRGEALGGDEKRQRQSGGEYKQSDHDNESERRRRRDDVRRISGYTTPNGRRRGEEDRGQRDRDFSRRHRDRDGKDDSYRHPRHRDERDERFDRGNYEGGEDRLQRYRDRSPR